VGQKFEYYEDSIKLLILVSLDVPLKNIVVVFFWIFDPMLRFRDIPERNLKWATLYNKKRFSEE
jgi:hypothetical protein